MFKLILVVATCFSIGIPVVKAVPSLIEYYTLKKSIATVLGGCKGDVSVQDLKNGFAKSLEIEYLRDVSVDDISIEITSSSCTISFAYEKEIPIMSNVRLSIAYSDTQVKSKR